MLCGFFQKTQRGQRDQQQDSRERPKFRLYNFSKVVAPLVIVEWRNRLAKLQAKGIHVSNEVDWD